MSTSVDQDYSEQRISPGLVRDALSIWATPLYYMYCISGTPTVLHRLRKLLEEDAKAADSKDFYSRGILPNDRVNIGILPAADAPWVAGEDIATIPASLVTTSAIATCGIAEDRAYEPAGIVTKAVNTEHRPA